MENHLKHLVALMGPLKGKRFLDLGAGKGRFLIVLAQAGISAIGLELNPAYIGEAKQRALDAGVSIDIREGKVEALPFADNSFDDANASEVIEHVESPELMLKELYRVLAPGGMAYLSVPNRFGMKDQHFHLYFVNWLPRAWSDAYIALFSHHKEYEAKEAGHQRLRDMHYYTYNAIMKFVRAQGFRAVDIRAERIKRMPLAKRAAMSIFYPAARACYFDAFHLLLTK